MNLSLYPEEALIVFVRRGTADPAQYMVGIRACQTAFDQRNDLKPVDVQRSVCEAGEFASLDRALEVAVQKLGQVASGSLPL